MKYVQSEAGRRVREAALLGAALLVAMTAELATARQAWAAPATGPNGVYPVAAAAGPLSEAMRVKLKDDAGFGDGTSVAGIATVEFRVVPRGYFGWHTHAGPVWVVVKQGELTLYDPEDPECARVYPAGTAFVDQGGGHVHNARNESGADTILEATFLLPEGAAPLTSVPNPGGACQMPSMPEP